MKQKIYISGPITDNKNYMRDFQECQDFLIKEGIYDPINPAVVSEKYLKANKINNPKWKDYMKAGLSALMSFDCNDIILLNNFWNSKGSKIESRIAFDLGYKFHYFIDAKRVKA